MIKKEEDEKEGTRHHSENPGRPTDSTSRGNDNYEERGAPERRKSTCVVVSFYLKIQCKSSSPSLRWGERVFGRKEGRGREEEGVRRRTEVDNSTQGNISKTGRTVIKNSSSSLPIYP
jgi:hypothetical protein